MTMTPMMQSFIQERLPRGIRLSRNSLLIDVSKKVLHNGKEKIIRKSKSVLLGLENILDNTKAKQLFESGLEDAIRLQAIMQREIAQSGYAEVAGTSKIADGSVGAIWVRFFPKVLEKMEERNQVNVTIFYNDVVEYFTAAKPLKDITEEEVEGFKTWLQSKITNRYMNNIGTCSNGSINKRLGVIRELMRCAIKNKYLLVNECIDPSKKNLGVEDLPRGTAQQKPALTLAEQSNFISVIRSYGDDDFANCMEFAFETGMRHSTELLAFTVDNVNFKRNTICFWRNKTKSWSIEMPLTKRAYEILYNYRETAFARPDKRIFPYTKSYIRSRWNKFKGLAKLAKNVTPYVTRGSFITRLVESGLDPRTVMKFAGHTCIETTLSFYVNPTNKHLQSAMSVLDKQRDECLKIIEG